MGVLATVPDPLLDGLVPAARLGAVLARRRHAAGETLTAVARRCPPAWTPDRLTGVERGDAVPLGDLATVVSAYGLDAGRWRPPHELRLVLERSPEATDDAVHLEPHWQLMRLAAVGVALGLDGRWSGGRSRLLAEAFGSAPRQVAAQLADALAAGHDVVTACVERARALPVVAAAGVLLARGVGGALVLTAPTRPGTTWEVPSLCPLGELVATTPTGV